jgi:hypothetical protein
MQQTQAHRVVIRRLVCLYRAEREGRFGPEYMRGRVVAEDEGLERGRESVQVWQCFAVLVVRRTIVTELVPTTAGRSVSVCAHSTTIDYPFTCFSQLSCALSVYPGGVAIRLLASIASTLTLQAASAGTISNSSSSH